MTTDAQGQAITLVSRHSSRTTIAPPGATVTTFTQVGADGTSTVSVQTLRKYLINSPVYIADRVEEPVTTTNAQGIGTTSTSTAGSVFITIPPSRGLTTYSVFPPGAYWSTTSVSTNTHDSSGHPILGPWPGCWFCPPGSHGYILLGFLPGVYPPGGSVLCNFSERNIMTVFQTPTSTPWPYSCATRPHQTVSFPHDTARWRSNLCERAVNK